MLIAITAYSHYGSYTVSINPDHVTAITFDNRFKNWRVTLSSGNNYWTDNAGERAIRLYHSKGRINIGHLEPLTWENDYYDAE